MLVLSSLTKFFSPQGMNSIRYEVVGSCCHSSSVVSLFDTLSLPLGDTDAETGISHNRCSRRHEWSPSASSIILAMHSNAVGNSTNNSLKICKGHLHDLIGIDGNYQQIVWCLIDCRVDSLKARGNIVTLFLSSTQFYPHKDSAECRLRSPTMVTIARFEPEKKSRL
jgi:hypothetical protein